MRAEAGADWVRVIHLLDHPRLASPIRVAFKVWMDADTVARGEYLEVDPPGRLVFTWGWEGNPDVPPGSSTVEVSLEPEGTGTVLTLRHIGLPNGEAAAMHEDGWRLYTGRLILAASGGSTFEPPPAEPRPA